MLKRRPWRSEGNTPDYRFSLANERTYLAWIRTALALLAGAIGIDQLAPDIATPVLRVVLSVFLCVCSGALAVFAYRRWCDNEKSMRLNQPLKYTSFLKTISVVLLLLAVVIILFVML